VDQVADLGPEREAESAELDKLRRQVRRQAGELERLRTRLTDLQRQIREHRDRTGSRRLIAGEGV
jgi:hypothetical protein